MNKRKIYTILGVVALAALSIFGVKNDLGLGRNMEMMVNLMRVVSTDYVDSISADKIMRHGADGIMRNLDPYCTFLSEEDMKEFRTLTTGKYGGIGSVIRQDSNAVRIAEPYKGSPADLAGLKIGDKIVAIDGKSIAGMMNATRKWKRENMSMVQRVSWFPSQNRIISSRILEIRDVC